MTEAPKKKAARTKPAHSREPKNILVRYADRRLKPRGDIAGAHPALMNNPDILRILPKSHVLIETGLEIAIPPNQFVISSTLIGGLLQINNVHTGYQKNLTLELMNFTSEIIEISPFERIANLYMCSMSTWV